MVDLSVRIMTLPHGAGLALPSPATPLSAGVDLPAAIDDDIELRPMQRALIPTGFAMALPPGFEAQVRPRSGLALRQGLTVLNSPGTIDADYRGEVKVLLINLGESPARITRGDRIAQMVVAPVSRIAWDLCAVLDETDRGQSGYGSTGVAARTAAK